MTAGSLCAHCVVGSLMCSVMGCGGPAGGGCVLFEKCIVDASISRDIGSDFSDWCCEV